MMNKTKLFLTYYNKNSVERLIKNRAHIIEIMINCLIQFINTTNADNQDNGLGYFEIISNDYYSRLFICQSNKIYSFNIPFKINIEEKNITALSSDLKIDSQILTVLKELITKNWFSEKVHILIYMMILNNLMKYSKQLAKIIQKNMRRI